MTSHATLDELNRLDQQMRAAYWQQKDLPAALQAGQTALGLWRAMDRLGVDDATLIEIDGRIKTIAYNIASFAWPGWDEPGIVIDAPSLEAAEQAADLNLSLALRLNRPPAKVRDAHWLIAAVAIARSEYAKARQHLHEAATVEDVPMIAGYCALVDVLERASGAEDGWVAALLRLSDSGDEDDRAFADQLRIARRVFER